MSTAERNKLKQDAKVYIQYIDSLFTNHEETFHETPKE